MQKKQRKLITSILVCVCYLCAIYAYKAEVFASEKGLERFNNEFIANANLQIKDDNIVILSETSLLETMESGEKRYVEDRKSHRLPMPHAGAPAWSLHRL